MPIEAPVRTELIDLMPRILVVVFQAEGVKSNEKVLYSPKIKPEHLPRRAIIYFGNQ